MEFTDEAGRLGMRQGETGVGKEYHVTQAGKRKLL
jgi:hypothetical protein